MRPVITVALVLTLVAPAGAGAEIITKRDRVYRGEGRIPPEADIKTVTITNGRQRLFVDLELAQLPPAGQYYYFYTEYSYESDPDHSFKVEMVKGAKPSMWRYSDEDSLEGDKVTCQGIKTKFLTAKRSVRLSVPHACADVPELGTMDVRGTAVGDVPDPHDPDSVESLTDDTQKITVEHG